MSNQSDNSSTSRRHLLAGAATLSAVGALSGQRAEAQSMPGKAGAPALSDPRTAYPAPPFAPQTQPWPGLQSRMHPRPDCGESSYKGTGRLQGRRALITGGDSGIGRAVAIDIHARH